MVYYKSIKIIIDIVGFVETIIDIVVRYYDLPQLIIND